MVGVRLQKCFIIVYPKLVCLVIYFHLLQSKEITRTNKNYSLLYSNYNIRVENMNNNWTIFLICIFPIEFHLSFFTLYNKSA